MTESLKPSSTESKIGEFMRKKCWLILLLGISATVNLSVSAQKGKLPSNINDAFVLEFAAPFEHLLIQTDEKGMPNRELTAVDVTPQTKIKNHKGKEVQASAILPGMEIEIEIDTANVAGFSAKEIKIRTNLEKREEGVDGYLDRIEETRAMVDGRIVEFAPNTILVGIKEWKGKTFTSFKEIPLGSLVDLKGLRQNNRVILVNRGKVRPNLFTPVETKLVETVKQGLVLPPPEKLGAGVIINGKSYKVCEDLTVNTYVNKVGNRIVPKFLRLLPPEDPNKVLFRFYVLEDETPNAAAFSDGSVFINTGLLKSLENEAQLAIILGHEIAHVTNEHTRRRFETQNSQAMWAGLLGAGAGIVGGQQVGLAVSKLSFSLMSNKFSRDLEDQADRVGLYYAYDAGYDMRESPKLWRKLIGSYREGAFGIALYSDHPAMLERLKESRREVVLNYANADFSEVVVGREKFVEGVGSYFGWIASSQLKRSVGNLPVAKLSLKKKISAKTQTNKKTVTKIKAVGDGFADFYKSFKKVVNGNSRTTIKNMMSANFEWALDGNISRDEAFRLMNDMKLWTGLKNAVLKMPVKCKQPYCNNREGYRVWSSARYKLEIMFEKDAAGVWHWTALLGD